MTLRTLCVGLNIAAPPYAIRNLNNDSAVLLQTQNEPGRQSEPKHDYVGAEAKDEGKTCCQSAHGGRVRKH